MERRTVSNFDLIHSLEFSVALVNFQSQFSIRLSYTDGYDRECHFLRMNSSGRPEIVVSS